MAYLTLPDGDELFHEITGSGEPLLLFSGLNGAASFWSGVVPHLSGLFTVITHDHRGTGQSTRALIAYSVEQMMGDAIALMDSLGIERATVIGHSTGGAMGQMMAIRHPARVSRLVLSATWTHCDPYIEQLFDVRRRILTDSGHAAYLRANPFFLYPPRWIRDNLARLRANDMAAAAEPDEATREITSRRIAAILRFDERERLHRITAPTLVISARDDLTIPSYFTEDLGRAIPGAVTVTLPEGGHFLPVVSPALYAAAIRPFLEATA